MTNLLLLISRNIRINKGKEEGSRQGSVFALNSHTSGNTHKTLKYTTDNFHRLGPVGRVDHRVAMSVCMCMSVIKVVIVDNGQSIRLFVLLHKLDGVRPVDNRLSNNKLHHFVQRRRKNKKKMWHVTCDTWHVTCDTWHVTRDRWQVTRHMWHVVGGEHSLKISAP